MRDSLTAGRLSLPSRSLAVRLMFAVLTVAIAAIVVRGLALAGVPHSFPPYLLAVLFSASYGGTGAGLLATLLATIAATLPPFSSDAASAFAVDHLMRIVTFIVAAVVTSSISAARRAAEQQLREALGELEAVDRAKDEFLATVSHELRTPLTSMHGWLEMMRSRDLDEETRTIALDSLDQSTRTQRMLVDDLLDVSRIVLGKFSIESQPTDLGAAVKGAVDLVRPAAEAKGVTVEMCLPEEEVVLSGDRNRLQQVVWNLLTNAVKFTPDGGHILVRLEVVDSAANLYVVDSGRGIAPDLLPHLFERFTQAAGAERKGGLGLGLSIVKQIVRSHGGRVSADNGAQGGAVFRVTIPLEGVPET